MSWLGKIAWRWTWAGLLLASACGHVFAQSATLLPNGMQQFVDGNGVPLAGGSVAFYVPNTLTQKTTWQDPAATQLNTNPVVLDGFGRAKIYGSGAYRQILKDQFGNQVWDALTADTLATGLTWAGQATGSANAIILVDGQFNATDGQAVNFIAANNNSGPTTVQINGGTIWALTKPTSTGQVALAGGEIIAGVQYQISFSQGAGNFQLLSVPSVPAFGAVTNLLSAATTDLGSVASHNVNVTGTTTINSFGSSATVTQPIYKVIFANQLVVTYNATTMLTPSGVSLTTAPGDTAELTYLGAGAWKVTGYLSASGGTDAPGMVKAFAANSTPAGYLLCDGSAVSRTTYSGLFSVIGVTYGTGDGSTTFNLPDLRGIFVRGFNAAGTADPGRTFGSYQADAFQHWYASFFSQAVAINSGGISVTPGGSAPNSAGGAKTTQEVIIDPALQAGVSTAVETRPKNVAMSYVIKF